MHTAIITGASAGIGTATAQAFLDAGYRVFNLSRRACPLEDVTSLACDFAHESSITACAEQLRAAIHKHDSVSLIHNACQMRKDRAGDCSSANLREVLETNLVAINSLNQILLPSLPPTSSVLFIGSTLSEKAVAGAYSYVISKHALLGMMRATAQDLFGSGVHTALICPGFTDTEMLRTHLGHDSALMSTLAAGNSFGRLVAPEEIAALLLWAHQNPVINGSVLHANLGQKEY